MADHLSCVAAVMTVDWPGDEGRRARLSRASPRLLEIHTRRLRQFDYARGLSS